MWIIALVQKYFFSVTKIMSFFTIGLINSGDEYIAKDMMCVLKIGTYIS